MTPGELAAAMAVAVKRFADSQLLQEKASKLENKLETRILVDRAKAKLMASGKSEEAAYKAIQGQARDNQLSMRQVALMILGQNKP